VVAGLGGRTGAGTGDTIEKASGVGRGAIGRANLIADLTGVVFELETSDDRNNFGSGFASLGSHWSIPLLVIFTLLLSVTSISIIVVTVRYVKGFWHEFPPILCHDENSTDSQLYLNREGRY
jgi:hypothetical protein